MSNLLLRKGFHEREAFDKTEERRGKRRKIVAVSGGFDPLHIGHIRHFKDAKRLGDFLIVFLQTDEWLIKKKGYFFMPYQERKEILESVKYIDWVVKVIDSDMSVGKTLDKYKPDIFAKGGPEYSSETLPKAEKEICEKLGIKIIYGVGGKKKLQSSSWLVKNLIRVLRKKEVKKD